MARKTKWQRRADKNLREFIKSIPAEDAAAIHAAALAGEQPDALITIARLLADKAQADLEAQAAQDAQLDMFADVNDADMQAYIPNPIKPRLF